MSDRYSNRQGKPAPDRGPAFDPDEPVAGFYQVSLVKGGPPCSLHIWFGLPVDPVTREEMDRAPRWLAKLNGVEMVDPFRFWPACATRPISFEEHRRFCLLSSTLDPDSAFYDPRRPIDRLQAKLPF